MKTDYYRGKTAVITGAASGIGRSLAFALAKLGTNLVLADFNQTRLDEMEIKMKEYPIDVLSMYCDVTNKSQVDALYINSTEKFEKIDFLFSNAGVAVGGHLEYITQDQWKLAIDTNIMGMINLVNTYLPKMLEQGGGHIIVTASFAGLLGVGAQIPYSTTKFANVGFCEGLYGEFNKKGIEVSVICPGALNTNLMDNAIMGYPADIKNYPDSERFEKTENEWKNFFWKKFCAESMDLDQAVQIFIKQISKKRFIVTEAKMLPLLMVFKGIMPKKYKKYLRSFGDGLGDLADGTIEFARKKLNLKEA